MKYRTLGRTGLKISEIGFGAWGIGAVMWKGAKDDESLQALNTAIDEGVNFLDTALVYGNGHSEKLVGEVVRARSERIYVATKVPPKNRIWPARGSLEEVFPSDYIVDCVENSLRNLGLERIDLLQLHLWDSEWLKRDEWFETLTELRQQGKMAYFGVSINDHQPDSALELVRSGKIDTVQVIYNIFDQSPEDRLFSTCLEQNVGVIVRVPFDEGSLTGKITPQTVFPKGDWRHAYFKGDRKEQVHERITVIESLLGEESNSLPDLALRFCLHPEAVSTVIPGMRSIKHVLANSSASEQPRLSSAMIEGLRKHRWVRNFYPQV